MEGLPDASKNPRELREEFASKIVTVITDEFNRAGRDRIQEAINKLIDNYSLDMDLQIDIDIKLDVQSMSGDDFVWPRLPRPSVKFGPID